MSKFPEGNAIIFCQGAFGTPNGKTAHGLVRRTTRYRVLSVLDAQYTGADAGMILDGRPNTIPLLPDLNTAYELAKSRNLPATHLVIGIAPDGGKLNPEARDNIINAIKLGLNIDSGLHDFLSEDEEIARLAAQYVITIRDVRKTPPRKELHFFNGKIAEVTSLKIAVLGTDSAVGKRTTAWLLRDAFIKAGHTAELIGTGQTAWMQGATYSIILDSIINDFVSGEIEHAIWSAWNDLHPDVILIEGQGSLMNPAYPGGFEILAAGRPDIVILQHAPARIDYDGFPGFRIHSLSKQIQTIELLSDKPVVAITINHENMSKTAVQSICQQITAETGLPAADLLLDGVDKIIKVLVSYLKKSK